MELRSENVKYLCSKEVDGKNGKYYLHTFLGDEPLTFYSKENISFDSMEDVSLTFKVTTYGGKNQFILIGVE